MACAQVRHLGNSTTTGGTTLTIGPLNGIAVGSAIGVTTTSDLTNLATQSVADDLSVAAIPINSTNAGGFRQLSATFYYKNYGGGNRSFTVTNSVTDTNRGLAVEEVSGADTVNPLGGSATNSGNSTTPSSGNLAPTPTLDGCYLFGHCAAASGLPAANGAAGFVDFFSDGTDFSDSISRIQSIAAAADVSYTAPSGSWQVAAAYFVPAPITSTSVAIPHRSLGPGRHVGSQFNQVVRSPLAYVVPDSFKTLVVPTRPLVNLGRFSFILEHRQNQGIFVPIVIVTLPPTRTLLGVGI